MNNFEHAERLAELTAMGAHELALMVIRLEQDVEAYQLSEELQIVLRQKADEREAALENRNAGLIQQCQDAEDQRDEYLNKLRALNHGDKSKAWHWMGDGNDHPESLCCPVLISSEDLNGIISGREAALERESALLAHMERLFLAWDKLTKEGAPHEKLTDAMDLVFSEGPETSLARRDLIKQAVALELVNCQSGPQEDTPQEDAFDAGWDAAFELIRQFASELRQRAQELTE
jgi:hypothetical protein